MKQFRTSEGHRPTFEETYQRYEFAPLVTIVLALGDWFANLQRDHAKRAPRTPVQTPEAPGRTARAS